jgi:aryl-phospho-beta-D-glucosidase BglC (GH1 family)
METDTFSPHGLDRRSLGSMLDQIKSLGYNSIRIPFSTQMLDAGSQAKGIDFAQNPSLQNKKPIEILDEVIRQAGARRLRIILDRHRPDAYSQANLWYTGAYSERRWIDDWKLLAARYKSDSTVVGFDLHNEPHGEATWGSGNQANDWRLAAERAGNEILAVHPDLLMIVEGIEQVGGKYYWWGGNLMAVGQNLVRLNVADRVVYSVHDYPASVYGQSWFSDAKYPANLPGVWDSYWGYVAKQNIAPVWIGEFGTKYLTDSDKKWMATLVDYISQNQLSFAYWCWNPNSNDTGGILKDDWLTINTDKQAVIAPALAPSL